VEAVERTFKAMGTEISIVVGPPVGRGIAEPAMAAITCQSVVAGFDRRLSRFRDDSELSALNRDPRSAVPASGLLRAAVRAGLWAAERSGGLVDPTLLGAIEAAGYAAGRERLERVPLAEALRAAPDRRPARAREAAEWRSIEISEAEEVLRPPGLGFDTGGTGKGLAADLAADRLSGYARFAVDCGGDIRVGGANPDAEPLMLEVRHPLDGAAVMTVPIRAGAAATSGLDVNVWRRTDGSYAHHLLDPATGEPAWTGLIAATALAPTAVAAETLSKAALLGGREAAGGWLDRYGGLVVNENGSIEAYGVLREHSGAP
jgi:FAD:protein FMN transferase